MIIFILLFIAAFSMFVMDYISFRWEHTPKFIYNNPEFWNPQVSWKNKWKKGTSNIEKFPLSSTILVFLTDAWHLFKETMLLSFTACITIAEEKQWYWIIIYKIFFSGVFEIFFSRKYTNKG